jgi:4-hydroxy-L-threonine phosphate dehydrogenase PdxA
MVCDVKTNGSPVVGIILGDPAGSSYELAVKTVLACKGEYIPVLVGNRERFEISRASVEGNERLEILELSQRPESAREHAAYFCDVAAGSDIHFSKVTADSGKLTYDSINHHCTKRDIPIHLSLNCLQSATKYLLASQ